MAWSNVVVSSELEGDVHVVTLLGELRTDTARQLADALAAAGSDHAKIVVDLTTCDVADVRAVQTLARTCRLLQSQGVDRLAVVAARDDLLDALAAHGSEPLAVYPTRDSAVSDGFVSAAAA